MSEAKVGCLMKYTYTFSMKVSQFPLKFNVQKKWTWRYWMTAEIVVAAPVFYKIHKMANNPRNLSKRLRKETDEHH